MKYIHFDEYRVRFGYRNITCGIVPETGEKAKVLHQSEKSL